MEDSTLGDDEDIYADVTEARLEAGLETARSTSTAPQQATTVKNALQAQGGASHLNAITWAPTPAATHAPPPSATSAPAASSAPSAVYIANLAWYTTDAEVEDLCRPFGPQNCHIVADKRSGRSKGYAVVDFADSEAAASAKVSASPSLTCATIKGFSMFVAHVQDELRGSKAHGNEIVVLLATAASLRVLEGGAAREAEPGVDAVPSLTTAAPAATYVAVPSDRPGRWYGPPDPSVWSGGPGGNLGREVGGPLQHGRGGGGWLDDGVWPPFRGPPLPEQPFGMHGGAGIPPAPAPSFGSSGAGGWWGGRAAGGGNNYRRGGRGDDEQRSSSSRKEARRRYYY